MIALLAAILASALFPAAAGATEVVPKEFTCPVCATKFTANVLVKADRDGGTDSDFCEWPKGTPALPFEAQACPSCFFAATNENFVPPLPAATVTALKEALTKWKEGRPEVKKVEDLSPGQRRELAAICTAVRGATPLTVGRLWLQASWTTRQCAGAGFHPGFVDPLSDIETLDALEAVAKKEKDGAKQAEALITLVWGAHRAGDVKRRDATLRRLAESKLDEAQTAKIDAMKKTFEQEKTYQERAAACFRMALDKEQTPPQERALYLYLVADLSRRTGRDAEALRGYREVKAAGRIRRDIAGLCDFFINYLGSE